MVEHDGDAALTRLEDVLLGLPFDRALPDLHWIMSQAGITEADLRTDDRTLKLLHEAVVARPLNDLDEVASLRTRIELLTLEVRVLAERLQDPRTGRADAAHAGRRLAAVRRELDRVRDLL